MRHHALYRMTAMALVAVLAVSGLFASATSEKQASFPTLNLESASVSQIEKAFESDSQNYQKEVEDLQKQLQKAYEKNDGEKFYALRDDLRSLTPPMVTSEQTETLVTRMLNASDDEKKQISEWLFENSRYYHPTLTMQMEKSGKNSRYSYHQGISVKPGDMVKLPDLSVAGGNDGVFMGWGITPDALSYKAGEEIAMPYVDQTLYAIFQSGIRFADTVTSFDQFTSGAEAPVPALTAPDSSYVFDGWVNDATGKKVEGEKVTLSENATSASFHALWKSVLVSDTATRYYKDNTIPSGEQVSLDFSLKNQGNEMLPGVSVKLESGDPSLKVLTENLSAYRLMDGETRSGTFVVLANAASGTTLNATLTVSDASGCSWKVPVSFTVK